MVNQLWDMAASGRLLNREGWEFASRYFFSQPRPWSGDGSTQVVSDDWSVVYEDCTGDTVLGKVLGEDEVVVSVASHWGIKPGRIDSRLHFTPPPPTSAYETHLGYDLVLTTLHIYKPTAKEPKRWVIQGAPPPAFATVTAAIRYVLEKRRQAKDPAIRKNADETIAELLKLR